MNDKILEEQAVYSDKVASIKYLMDIANELV